MGGGERGGVGVVGGCSGGLRGGLGELGVGRVTVRVGVVDRGAWTGHWVVGTAHTARVHVLRLFLHNHPLEGYLRGRVAGRRHRGP